LFGLTEGGLVDNYKYSKSCDKYEKRASHMVWFNFARPCEVVDQGSTDSSLCRQWSPSGVCKTHFKRKCSGSVSDPPGSKTQRRRTL